MSCTPSSQNSKPPDGAQRNTLLAILGTGFGLAVIIGGTIGTGILRTPGVIAANLDSPWLFIGVWVVGGVYSLLGALTVAELGTMMPRAGGQYVFAQRALGNYAGFIVGWSDWMLMCGAIAAVAIVASEYIRHLSDLHKDLTVALALMIIVGFAMLQWRGLRWGSRTQEITSVIKAAAFMILVVACFMTGRGGTAPIPAEAASPERGFIISSIFALQGVVYAYGGWTGLVCFSEELQNPERDLPRAMFGGVLWVMAIYVLINLALLYVMPVARIANQEMAIGTASGIVFGESGDKIIRVIMILSILANINAYHLESTRVLFGMSRDGLFWGNVTRVNAGGTPFVALLISTAVAILFTLSGTFEKILSVLASFLVINSSISFLSVFILRRREPHATRPYTAWGFPWTTGLLLICSLTFLIGVAVIDTLNSLLAFSIMAASYPAYFILRKRPGRA